MDETPMTVFDGGEVVIPMTTRPLQWFHCKPVNGEWEHAWDVTRANLVMIEEVKAGRLHRLCNIPLHEQNRQMFLNSGTELNAAHWRSDRCDPRVPILIVPMFGQEWIIDGWHRVRRAIEMDWPEISAFRLTSAEDRATRICPCCRGRDVPAVMRRQVDAIMGPRPRVLDARPDAIADIIAERFAGRRAR